MEIHSKGGEGYPLQCALSLRILSPPPLTLPLKPTTSQVQVQRGGGEENGVLQGDFFFLLSSRAGSLLDHRSGTIP